MGITTRKYVTKDRPTPSRANINPADLCSAFGAHDGFIWISKGLGSPNSPALPFAATSLSGADTAPCLGLSSDDDPQFWYLQHPGIHTATYTSL